MYSAVVLQEIKIYPDTVQCFVHWTPMHRSFKCFASKFSYIYSTSTLPLRVFKHSPSDFDRRYSLMLLLLLFFLSQYYFLTSDRALQLQACDYRLTERCVWY